MLTGSLYNLLETHLMTKTVKLTCLVQGKNNRYEFEVVATKCASPSEHSIPTTFYIKNHASVPEGNHWELPLTKSPVWGRVVPDVPVHIYADQESGNHYVCFTGNIETLETAEAVFRYWCLGTVYTIENHEDFASVTAPERVDFSDYLQDEFGIHRLD